MAVVNVLIPLAVPKLFAYRVPPDMSVSAGDFVRVPFGARRVSGVVWETDPDLGPAAAKLKDIFAKHDAPPLRPEMRQFIDWVAAYVMAPRGQVLRQAMRPPSALAPPKPLLVCAATDKKPPRVTPARQKVLDMVREKQTLTAADLAREAGVSGGVVGGLLKTGALATKTMAVEKPFLPPDLEAARRGGPRLSPEQAKAANALRQAVFREKFGVHVLDGVTGSGKTEVYFEAVTAALESGKNILILLPEISLTAQFLERFEARFGVPPAVWHSGLGEVLLRRTWREIAANRVRVLVGARSALFLPWHALGLVVVDEEHDGGYKQEDGVVYNARDMAVVRARFAACPIILSSATPSLETFVNMRDGRYRAHRLTARAGGASLPAINIIDMRQEKPLRGKWLAPPMVEAVGATLARGEQSLLFLNRRGYAPLILCRACGHRYACPSCDAWLVAHDFGTYLQCHHCARRAPAPKVCDSCGEAGHLAACGPGVERICEEVTDYFPAARIVVLSSDHVQHADAAKKLISQIADGGADIIIGTQVVAKGHHFPQLATVGVVDADLGLGNGDLRAAERTYQILSQVAGRAGRERTKGAGVLQTHMPDHPVLCALAAGDRDAFLTREAAARQAASMPPFGRLAAIIVSARERDAARLFAETLARQIPPHENIRVLGPAPAPLARLRNRYRFRFLVKARKHAPIQSFIGAWVKKVTPRGTVRVQIDIDPYQFM